MNRKIAALLLLCMLLAGLGGCKKAQAPATDGDGTTQDQPENPQTGEEGGSSGEQPSQPETKTLRLVAGGDNLLHDSVSKTAQQSDGSYDYSSLYEMVAPVIAGSDIAFVNQEVMLTGEVSAYPSLAARAECADALVGAGFNIINLATNHALDKGVAGLQTCLENIHARKFDAVLGAFRTQEEAGQAAIVEKQGVKFGFLSYTYAINGGGLPEGKQWMVSCIDRNKIRSEVTALRSQCDYLVVSMHWGTEYQDTQNAEQTELAKLLSSLGVDLVIGTHPHVLQPAVWYDRPDGGKMYCVYSLGNFVSNQRKWAAMLGGLLDMTLEFDSDGKLLQVRKAGIIPLVTQYEGQRNHRIYLLQSYTEELAAAHGIREFADPLKLSWLQEHAAGVLGDQLARWDS